MQRNKRTYGSLQGGLDFSTLRSGEPTLRQPLSPATPVSDDAPTVRSAPRRSTAACTTPPLNASTHPWAQNGGVPPAPRALSRRQMPPTPSDDDEDRFAKRQRRSIHRDMQPRLLWPQSPSASPAPCAFAPLLSSTQVAMTPPPSAQRRLSGRLAARSSCSRSSSPLHKVRAKDEGVAGLEPALQMSGSINAAPKSIAAVTAPSCIPPQASPPILQLRCLAARAPLRTRAQLRAATAAASSSSSNGANPLCATPRTPCSPRATRDRSTSCSSSTSGASNGRRCTPIPSWRGSGASSAWRGRGGTPGDYFGNWSGAIC